MNDHLTIELRPSLSRLIDEMVRRLAIPPEILYAQERGER